MSESDSKKEEQTPTPRASRARGGADYPRWRRVLDESTGWRERTEGLDVTYYDDGIHIDYVDPSVGRALTSILQPVFGTTLRGGRRPNGEYSVGFGG